MSIVQIEGLTRDYRNNRDLFHLFNPDGIIACNIGALWGVAALFFGSILLFSSAILIFNKKDLHI